MSHYLICQVRVSNRIVELREDVIYVFECILSQE